MKIYTKTGDNGTTGLLTGKRVPKNDLRIEAYGTVDELNAWIGLLGELDVVATQKQLLKGVQDRLFNIGGTLASGDSGSFTGDLQEADIHQLENAMDQYDLVLDPLKHFVLPGGSVEIAWAHVARTVCRRAERLVVALSQASEVEEMVIRYLNRLSDFLFVLSRWMAKQQQVEEVKWMPRK